MKERPIGVFDSGLGGLTAVKELRQILPGEDIVYFGDTGRVPYGSRGRDIIISYTRQDIAFLLSQKVKTVMAACGTASSAYPKEEAQGLPVRFMGVVQAGATAAVKATRNGRVGVIGTLSTIHSGSYQRAITALNPEIECVSAPCPLFVPLVEDGRFAVGDPMATLAVEEYLSPIRAAGVDTLVLGCTHYPLLADAIGRFMGPGVFLVDPGREGAQCLREILAEEGLLRDKPAGGTLRYYVSDEPEGFRRQAAIFLPDERCSAQRINIERYDLDLILKGYQPGLE